MTLLVLLLLELPGLVGAIDAARIPAGAWVRTGHSKTTWILLQLLLGWLGALLYFAAVRPNFGRPRQRAASLGAID